MINIRKSKERGHNKLSWLDTYHTFSFADYYDPKHMGFRRLRVINDDKVAAGGGFATHPHKNMEIITYILEGSLRHTDSMGNTAVLKKGEIQVMSAGSGITHSEVNASDHELLHLLQIWIEPEQRDIPPAYQDKNIDVREQSNKLVLVASHNSAAGGLPLNQDASVHAGFFNKDNELEYKLSPSRHAWLHLARGKMTVNGHPLETGDGISFSEEDHIKVYALEDSEFLLFDLN